MCKYWREFRQWLHSENVSTSRQYSSILPDDIFVGDGARSGCCNGSSSIDSWWTQSCHVLGLITNLTNVKAAVFAVAFLPQFVPDNFSLRLGIFIFGALWPLVSMSWYLILVWTVDKSATFIQRAPVRRALTAISAIGIAALAIGLALSTSR